MNCEVTSTKMETNRYLFATVARHCANRWVPSDMYALSFVCKSLGHDFSDILFMTTLSHLYHLCPQHKPKVLRYPRIPPGYIKLESRNTSVQIRLETIAASVGGCVKNGEHGQIEVSGRVLYLYATNWLLINCSIKAISESALAKFLDGGVNIAIDSRVEIIADWNCTELHHYENRMFRFRNKAILNLGREFFHLSDLRIIDTYPRVLFIQNKDPAVIKESLKVLNGKASLARIDSGNVEFYFPFHHGWLEFSYFVLYGESIPEHIFYPKKVPHFIQKKNGPIFYEYPPLDPYPSLIS